MSSTEPNPEQCWFCERSQADHASSATVEMHVGDFVGKTTQYEVREIEELAVPRCERCKSVHDRVEGYVARGGIFGLLLGIPAALFYLYDSGVDSVSDKGTWKGALLLIAVFAMVGGVAAWGLGRITIPKDVKDQRTREQHPLVQQRIQTGWKIGPKPPGL